MSTTVDERVVEMTFDNKQFEKNVKESMSTIDKLKEKLNFKGMKDGLDDFQESASKFDLDEMEKAADSVSIKFSALEAAGLRVIQRITDAAFDAGVSMVKSLSVDNISAGWDKFKDKTTSVATLISQGYDMDTVNAQLERLNWFTDETSYNFTEMVSSISKFTASGQDLKQSVDAMEGIATWAALSGQNATTASRAMYQLSQAMGSGQMRKQDWMSIQNANMDTEEFRQKAIDAAVALGNLEKIDEDLYISTLGGKNVTPFKVSQFADHLTEDAWFTSEVMMAVFQDYSAAVDQLYEYTEETGKTASEAIEDLGDQLDAFGLKAFKAAQEAKTWTDVIDSVKDAVGTGWMNTFENIFGDYEEQRVLWTDLANELYYIFAESGNERNEILADWKELKGRELIFANDLEHGNIGAFWNIFYAFKDFVNNIKESFRNVFPKKTAEELYDIAENIKTFSEKLRMSEETSEKFRNVLYQFFSAIKGIGNVIGYIYKVLAKPIITKIFDMLPVIGNKFIVPIYRALTTLYGIIDGIVNDFGNQFKNVISDISGAAKGTISLSSIIEKIGKIIATIIGYVATLLWQIHESELAISIIKGIAKVITTIFDIIKALFDLISGKSKWSEFVSSFAEIGKNIVTGLGNGIKNAFNIIVGVIKAFANFVINTFKSILGIHSPSTVFEGFGENIGQGLVNGIKKISQVVFDVIKWFGNTIIDIFKEIIDFISGINISNFIKTSFNKIVSIINTIGSWISDNFSNTFKSIKNMFSSGLKDTQDSVDKFKDIDTNGIDSFTDKTEKAFHPLSSLLNGIKIVFNGFASAIKKVLEFLSPVFDAIGNLFIKIKNKISDFIHNTNSSDIFDFLTKLINLYTSYGIGKLLNGIGSVGKSLSYALDGIYSALNGFGKKMIMSGIADIIKSIGKSMLELAAAVLILTLIKTDKLKAASIAIGALLAEIIGAISAVLGFSNAAAKGLTPELIKKLTGEALIIRSIGKLIQKMAVSILIIAVAALIIGKAKPDALTQLGEILLAIVLAALSIVYIVNKSNFTEKDVNKFKDISKLMKAMAGAVLVLAIVAVVMKFVDWPEIGKVGALLGGAVVAVLGVAIIMTKMNIDATKLDSFTTLVKKLAGAVLVLSIVAIIMKFVNWTDLAKVGVALVGFIGIITAAAYIMTKLNVDSNKLDSFTNLVKKLAGAILVLSITAIIMKFVSWTDLAKVGVTLVGFVAVLVAATVILSKFANSENDKIFDKLGKIMLKFVLVILVLAAIAFAITIVSWTSLAKVGSILLGFMAVLVATLALYKKINLSEKQMSHLETLMIMFAGVIAAISIIAYLMKEVGWGDLGKVGAVLLGLLIGISALCVIASIVDGSKLESFGKGLLSASIGILAFAAGVALFAGGLYLLSIVSSDGIETIRNVLTELVLFIPKFIAAVITGLIDAVSMIANKLPELKDDILLIISTIIELLVRAIADNTILIVDSVLNLIFTVLTKIGEYSYKITSALFDILIGVVKATFDRLPELIENIANIFMNVVTILSDVFNDMDAADFLAAIAVSEGMKLLFESMVVTFVVGVGLSYLLVECADNLVIFGEKITPFLDMLSSYDPKIIESAKNLAETILMFTGSSILDAIGSFVGGKDISEFGEEFAKLGPGLVKFGESVKDVDADTIQKASIAAQSITAFVNDIPREGGLLQKVIGEIDFKGFAEGLAEFGPAFASYAQSVEGIDKATIQNSTEAAMFITKFAKSIPNTGGLLADLLGDNTLDEFGRQLLVFGPAFATYALMMVGIPVETVKASSEAALTVAKFAKEVPNSGGALAKLLGDNRLDDFGEQLKVFGPAFAEYAKKMRGINKQTVQVSTEAATLVAKFAKEVPNTGGALGWLVGDNRLDDFGEQLKSFGPAFADYITSISDSNIDKNKLDIATEAVKALVEINKNIPASGGLKQIWSGEHDLQKFAVGLGSLADNLSDFLTKVSDSDINTTNLSIGVDIMKAIAEINKSIPASGGLKQIWNGEHDLRKFAVGLGSLADGLSDFLKKVSNNKVNTDFVKIGVNILKDIATVNSTIPETGGIKSLYTGTRSLGGFANELPTLATQLSSFMSVASAISFDPKKAAAVAEIAMYLANAFSVIPETGGIKSWINGDEDLEKFGKMLPSFAKSLLQYINTFTGSVITGNLSNALDAATIGFYIASTFADMFGQDNSISTSVMTKAEKTGDAMKSFATGVNTMMGTLTGINTNYSDSQLAKFERIAELGIKIGGLTYPNMPKLTSSKFDEETFKSYLGVIQTFMSFFAGDSSNLKTALAGLSGSTDTYLNAGESAAEVAEKISGIINSLNDIEITKNFNNKTFTTNISTAFDAVAHGIVDFITVLKPLVNGGFNNITTFNTITNNIASMFEHISSIDWTSLLNMYSSLTNIGHSVAELLSAGINDKTSIETLSTGISDSFNAAINNLLTVQATGNTLFNSQQIARTPLMDSLADSFNKVGKEMATLFADGLTSGITTTIIRNAIYSAVNKLFNPTTVVNKTYYNSLLLQWKTFGSNASSEFWNGFSDGFKTDYITDRIGLSLKKVQNSISDYFNGKYDTAYYHNNITPYQMMVQNGKYLLIGLIAGMSDPNLLETYEEVTDNISKMPNNRFRDLNTIESPSKVFYENGKYIVEGLALGMSDSSGVNMLISSITKICDIIQNDVDAQPTIRPVMDLTEIQNGVKLANSVTAGLNGAYVTGSYNMASDTAYRANLRQAELNNASNVSVASEVGRILGEVVASNGTTFNNTFNITGDDPEEIAEEVSRIIQQDMERRNAVWA